MRVSILLNLVLFQILQIGFCSAFLPHHSATIVRVETTTKSKESLTRAFPLASKHVHPFTKDQSTPFLWSRQRRSVASIQLMDGLFGLGFLELAVIVVATVIVVGPQKISEIAKDSGKFASQIPEELKQIPDEFQKGVEEGETNFRARNAKKMLKVPDEKKSSPSEKNPSE